MIIQARCMNCDEVIAEADLSKPCSSMLDEGQWFFSLKPCCSKEHMYQVPNSCIYLSIKEDDSVSEWTLRVEGHDEQCRKREMKGWMYSITDYKPRYLGYCTCKNRRIVEE